MSESLTIEELQQANELLRRQLSQTENKLEEALGALHRLRERLHTSVAAILGDTDSELIRRGVTPYPRSTVWTRS